MHKKKQGISRVRIESENKKEKIEKGRTRTENKRKEDFVENR